MSLSPKRGSLSPYSSPNIKARYPPAEKQWESTLRESGGKPSKPIKKQQSKSTGPFGDADLNELIAASIAQLRVNRLSLQTRTRGSDDCSIGVTKEMLKDAKNVDLLLKAAEDVKQKWSQRQALNAGQSATLTPTSRQKLVQRMIERTRHKPNSLNPRLTSSLPLETEPNLPLPSEDSPNFSPSRVIHTEESPPQRVENQLDLDPSPIKKLRAELKAYQEKYRKIETLYASLIAKTERSPGKKGDFRRMYDDLRAKYAKEQVKDRQKQWQIERIALGRQLEEKSSECNSLREQLSRVRLSNSNFSVDLTALVHLQQEVEDMKIRVAKTERDNESLRSQLPSRT